MIGEEGFQHFKSFVEASEKSCHNKNNYQSCVIDQIQTTLTVKHVEFPKKFIPIDKLGVNTSLYIDVVYPFDGNERLYFINTNANSYTDDNTKIFMFYDSLNDKWYLFNDSFTLSKFNIKKPNGDSWKRDIYYDREQIKSYNQFISLVKSEKDNLGESKWLELHPENKYKEGDTSNIWLHIKE